MKRRAFVSSSIAGLLTGGGAMRYIERPAIASQIDFTASKFKTNEIVNKELIINFNIQLHCSNIESTNNPIQVSFQPIIDGIKSSDSITTVSVYPKSNGVVDLNNISVQITQDITRQVTDVFGIAVKINHTDTSTIIQNIRISEPADIPKTTTMVMNKNQRDSAKLYETDGSKITAGFAGYSPYSVIGDYGAKNGSNSSDSAGEYAEWTWDNQICLIGVSEITLNFVGGTNAFRNRVDININSNQIASFDFPGDSTYERTYSIPSNLRDKNQTLRIRITSESGSWPGTSGFDNIRPKIFQTNGANL